MDNINRRFVIVGVFLLVIASLTVVTPVSAEKFTDTSYFVGETIIQSMDHSQTVGDDIQSIFPKNKSNYNYHGASSHTIVTAGSDIVGIDQKVKVEAAYTNKYSMTKTVEVPGYNGMVSVDTVGMLDSRPAITPLECSGGNIMASKIAKEGQVASDQWLEQEYAMLGPGGVVDIAHSVQNANVSVSGRVQEGVGGFSGRILANGRAGLDVSSSTVDYEIDVNDHFLVTGNNTKRISGESNMKWEDFSSPFRMTNGASTKELNVTDVEAANNELANATANTTEALDNSIAVMEFTEPVAKQSDS